MNSFKTALLLAAMTALFMAVGFAVGGRGGLMIAFIFAVLTNGTAYWYGDKIILRLYKAQEVKSGPLYNRVAQLVRHAALPMPKVYIVDNPQPNAFATGRNPDNAAVAATTGLIEILSQEELDGVMAHELAHIQNRDSLIMMVTATIAGAIGMLANMAFWMGLGGRGNRNTHPIVMILIIILAPIAATLVQMAISRTREYKADRRGAQICGNPDALASALDKLGQRAKRYKNAAAENNPATAHLFIVNPLRGHSFQSLFSTHPPMAKRISALRQMQPPTGHRRNSPLHSRRTSKSAEDQNNPWR